MESMGKLSVLVARCRYVIDYVRGTVHAQGSPEIVQHAPDVRLSEVRVEETVLRVLLGLEVQHDHFSLKCVKLQFGGRNVVWEGANLENLDQNATVRIEQT